MKQLSVISILVLMFNLQVKAQSTILWNLNSSYGVTQSGLASIISDARNHFATFPNDIIIVDIDEGTYYIGGNGGNGISFNGGGTGLSLEDKGRLIFQGAGMYETTLVFTDESQDMINGRATYHLEFRDMFMTRSEYTVTQGTVVSVSPGEVVLDIEPGFPSPSDLYTETSGQGRYMRKYNNTNKLDPQIIRDNNDQVSWGYRNPDNIWPVEDPNVSGRWTLYLNNPTRVAPYSPGDYIGVKSKGAGHIYWFAGGDDLVFINIRWRNSSRGLVRGGFSNVGLYGCRIEREDPINGQAPCMSTPSGGPQMNQNGDAVSTNMFVEDCYIDSPGDDNVAFFNVDGGRVKNTVIRNGFARGILATEFANNICLDNVVLENATIRDGPINQTYFYQDDAVMAGGAYNNNCVEQLSVKDNELINVRGYPNPAKTRLNIKGFDSTLPIEIYNTVGMLVKRMSCQESIDVYYLSQGLYILKQSDLTVKFIKK